MTDWIDETVAAFGRSIGIQGLDFDNNGVICLEIERMGVLFMESRDDGVLVYLARQMSGEANGWEEKALKLCHYKNGWPRQVYCGLTDDDRLVLLTRIPGREFVQAELEGTIALLSKIHDQVAQA